MSAAVNPQTPAEEASLPDAAPGPETGPRIKVRGELLQRLPDDLYIPPEALEVFLEAFEGPLDLLLYLIKRQNLDICDIPIADITRQYIQYIELMKELRLELAAEYLVMAAMLAEIKSRMLLPRPKPEQEDEGDPRAELIRRLQQYERFKQAAEDLDALPRLERDLFETEAAPPDFKAVRPQPEVDLKELLLALKSVMERAAMFTHHQVEREQLSLRERMTAVLAAVEGAGLVEFTRLFTAEEGRAGVVVSFMAILELTRQRLVDIVQTEAFGSIHVRAARAEEAYADDTDPPAAPPGLDDRDEGQDESGLVA
jgi:segregation and condensation protein A